MRGPWYAILPSAIRIMSSKRSKVSGAGWRSEINAVALVICTKCFRKETIWKVVELSKPFDISSMKRALVGPTINSPIKQHQKKNLRITLIVFSNKKLNLHVSIIYSIRKLPVVSLFFWPPETPLLIASPTSVSAHISSPRIWKKKHKKYYQANMYVSVSYKEKQNYSS